MLLISLTILMSYDFLHALRQWLPRHPRSATAAAQPSTVSPTRRRHGRPGSGYVMLVASDICPEAPWPWP